MLICTSICANYLPKALCLAESIKAVNPGHLFVTCLCERELPDIERALENIDRVVLTQDLGLDAHDAFLFKHSIVEASTAVKGRLLQFLFQAYPEQNHLVYLDPDIIVYSDLTEVEDLLSRVEIVLAPHLLRPGNLQMEISCLKHGVFNLGFLALSRGVESERFLDWWTERLNDHCRDDIPGGMFTDQKWINLAPCFFTVHILKHEGYDFATWSLLTTPLIRRDGIIFAGEDDPLRFVHFSGMDDGTLRWAMGQWLKDDPESPFWELYADYENRLRRHGQETLGRLPWTYARYASGEEILPEARKAFREHLEAEMSDPFSSSNAEILELAAQRAEQGEGGA